jgi:DNA-binding NarL/FixJ family response regulator
MVAGGRKLTREGLCALVHRRPDLRVVGEADDVAAACRLIVPLDVKVLTLIARPPACQVTDVARGFRSLNAHVGIVAVVPEAQHWDVRPLLEAGVNGCLTLTCSSDELVAAVRAAAAGRSFVSPALVAARVDRPRTLVPTAATLAPRELEVLRRIASGRSTKEIACDLKCGPKTIETHRRRIMKKLDRHSVAELTHFAIRNGLITLEPLG